MILYFSGTGNSRYVAEMIAEVTGEALMSLNEKIKNGDVAFNGETGQIVFVSPTYAWRIPHVMEQWIRNAVFPEGYTVWFIMTCGSEIGNAAKYNYALAKEKGFTYMGTAGVVMPENYIAMFDAPRDAKAKAIIEKAGSRIRSIAQTILEGEALPLPRNNLYDRAMSSLVNPLFYRFCVKADAFYSKDSCVGCGKCEELCPLSNIHLADGRPVWGKNCTHCMACICLCPNEAIEYGKKSKGKPRYHI